jgi:hypothetical protein
MAGRDGSGAPCAGFRYNGGMSLRSAFAGVAVALCAATAYAAPAAVAAPLQSDNVTLLTKLPEAAGAASARFSPDGTVMYVSTFKGLHTYDIKDPADPKRLGFLALPHFENEDVDAGDGVVIISNDPSEGLGLIYVIDVRDPALPTIRTTIRNGDILGVSNELGVDETKSNTGHIANCLQECRWLWTTGTDEGISIFDLRDLDAPRFVKTMQMPAAKGKDAAGFTHDVYVDRSGIAWITGKDGTFGYTTADPENPQLAYRSDEDVLNSGNDGPSSPDTAQDHPLDFLHHNSIRTDIQLAQKPVTPGIPEETPGNGPPATTPPGSGSAPGGSHGTGTAPGAPSPVAAARPRPKRPKSLKARIARCKKVTSTRRGERRCNRRAKAAHRVAVRRYRKRLAAWRSSRPEPRYLGRAGSRTTFGGLGDVVAITEEDYTRPTCNGQGSLQTWQITPGTDNSDGSTKLRMLDMWTTELNGLSDGIGRSPATVLCSAHWFDEDRGLLAQGWYDQGVRFLDISDPRDIRQVGYWVTSGTFWGAYFAPTDPTRSIVYGLDVAGGIDVLRIDRAKPAINMATVRAPVANRWLAGSGAKTGAQPSKDWGFACPILASVVR